MKTLNIIKLLRFFFISITLMLSMTVKADGIDIANGSNTSVYVPIYGGYGNQEQHNQILYPSSRIPTTLIGVPITKMTFYLSSTPNWNIPAVVKLMNTKTPNLSAGYITDLSSATQVYSGNITVANGQMVITFQNSFVYNGDGLLFDIETKSTSMISGEFYGITVTNSYAALYTTYFSNINVVRHFFPKVTVEYTPPVAASVITRPATNITNNSFTINGLTSNVTGNVGFKYRIDAGAWQYAAAQKSGNDISYNLTGLTASNLVHYYAFGVNGTDTTWGEMLAHQIPMEIAYITIDGAGSKNGSSWANAYPASQLQDAISTATSEVRIASGEYSTTTPYDENTTFRLTKDYFRISGAWDPATNTQKPATITTVLKANGNRRVLSLGGAWQTVHCLTITGGNTTTANEPGGGIRIEATVGGATVENCIVAGNRITRTTEGSGGAGIYVASNTLTVTINNCLIVNNSCLGSGKGYAAAVCVQATTLSYTTLNFCTIAGNASGGSESVRTAVQYVTANNCIFWGNGSNNGVHDIQGYSVTLNNCAYKSFSGGGSEMNKKSIENTDNTLFIKPNQTCGYDQNWANYNWNVNPATVLANSSDLSISHSISTDIIGVPRQNGSALGAYEKNCLITLSAQPVTQGTVRIDNDPAGSNVTKLIIPNESCTITAIPATDYRFVNWKEADQVVFTTPTATLSSVTSSRTLTAHFISTTIVTVITGNSSNVETNTATVKGEYVNVNSPTFVGFKYWLEGDPGNVFQQAATSGTPDMMIPFTANLTGLLQLRTYQYTAYVSWNGGFATGDTLTFTTKASCFPPTDLKISNPTLTGFTVSWTPTTIPAETQWVVYYRKEGTSTWQEKSVTGASSTVLSGLTSFANYQIRVRAVCNPGVDYSDYSQTITETFVGAISNEEELKGFRNYINASTHKGSGMVFSIIEDITLTSNWTKIDVFRGTLDGNFYKLKNFNMTATTENQGLVGQLNGGTIKNLGIADGEVSSSSINVGAFAGLCNNGGTIEACYNHANVLSTGLNPVCAGGIVGLIESGTVKYCYNTGRIGISSNPKNHVGGIAGAAIASGNNTVIIENSYNKGAVYPMTSGGGIAGVVMGANNATNWNNQKASAKNSYNVAGVPNGARIAHLAWQPSTRYGSIVNCYYLAGISGGSGEQENSTSGISISTTEDDFKAEGMPVKLINGQAQISYKGRMVNIWYADNIVFPVNGGFPILFYQFVDYDNPYAVTLSADAKAIEATLHGWYMNVENPSFTGFYYRVKDMGVWKSVAGVRGTQNPDLTIPVTATLTSLLPETTYEYKMMAFNSTDTAEGNIKTFTTIATCLPPVIGTGTALSGGTSISISWTEVNSATSWIVAYKRPSDPNWTEITVTSKPATVSGLIPATDYQFKVRSKCSDMDISVYSDEKIVKTGCGTVNLPFYEGFSAATPDCWNNQNTTGNASSVFTFVSTGTYPTCAPKSGNYMAKFNSFDFAGGTKAILTTIAIHNLSGAKIDFWMYRDARTEPDLLKVYASTTGLLDNEAELLLEIHRSTSLSPSVTEEGWHNYIASVSGNKDFKCIIFEGTATDWGNNIYIDEISITAPTCAKPENFSATSLTATTAKLIWNPVNAGLSYQLEYRAVGASQWISLPTTTETNTTIFSLTPLTAYEARLHTICGTTDNSVWATLNFTTSNLLSGTYLISASASAGGTIDPEGLIEVAENENSPLFTFQPENNYKIFKVWIDSVENETAANTRSHTFMNVTSNHTIYVEFEYDDTHVGDYKMQNVRIYSHLNTIYIENRDQLPLHSIEIMDMTGRVIYSSPRVKSPISLDIAQGVYIVRLTSDDTVLNTKVVIK